MTGVVVGGICGVDELALSAGIDTLMVEVAAADVVDWLNLTPVTVEGELPLPVFASVQFTERVPPATTELAPRLMLCGTRFGSCTGAVTVKATEC